MSLTIAPAKNAKDAFANLFDSVTAIKEVSAAMVLAARGLSDGRDRTAILFLAAELEGKLDDAAKDIEAMRDVLGLMEDDA